MENIVLGTMNIHYPHTSNKEDNVVVYTEIINNYLKAYGKNSFLDTAYYYGNTRTEQTLGEILPKLDTQPKIATKVNPWYHNDFSLGRLGQLNREGIHKQISTSLHNLKTDSVEILFLHCPDYETPLEETLETCDTLWRRNKFNYFGVSNFSLTQLKEVYDVCEKNGYIVPLYYQGMYNVICRKVEEVFPYLNDNCIEFWGYNPLAGGLLTGKYAGLTDIDNIVEDSRFKNNKIYQSIFWKKDVVENLSGFFELGKEKCTQYSLKWLQDYSKLNKTDKIVIGVSTPSQLNDCLNILNNVAPLQIEKNYFDRLYYPIYKHTPNYWY